MSNPAAPHYSVPSAVFADLFAVALTAKAEAVRRRRRRQATAVLSIDTTPDTPNSIPLMKLSNPFFKEHYAGTVDTICAGRRHLVFAGGGRLGEELWIDPARRV